jgi:3-oxoacyl-[acyl-carrier-protein] synthase-3
MFEVYITRSGKYLPNEAISNDEMESFLGLINDSASKARRIILRNNGITSRYYALDIKGNPTHTNAELANNAINTLFDTDFTSKNVELLSCGTSTPDHLLPSHAAMVHGLMKSQSVELNSSSGVCNAGMNALKFGYLSIKSGNTSNAVCSGSERVSTWMQANKYENEIVNLKKLEEQPIIAFKKDFLRWMLSDGAGAFLLENKKRGNISLKIEWMEAFSYAHELEACMYAGGDKLENGTLKPWSDYNSNEWLSESVFAIKQDVKILDQHILVKGAESMKLALTKNNIQPQNITYFLPHVSSHYFVNGLYNALKNESIEIPMKNWFMNLKNVGNVGSASIYLMLLSVPESGRFSYSYAFLTVC